MTVTTLALMFLKHYATADRKLVQGLNGNLYWQFFCGIYIRPIVLDNFKVVSEIRSELVGKFDMGEVQRALFGNWSPHMQDKGDISARWERPSDTKNAGRPVGRPALP